MATQHDCRLLCCSTSARARAKISDHRMSIRSSLTRGTPTYKRLSLGRCDHYSDANSLRCLHYNHDSIPRIIQLSSSIITNHLRRSEASSPVIFNIPLHATEFFHQSPSIHYQRGGRSCGERIPAHLPRNSTEASTRRGMWDAMPWGCHLSRDLYGGGVISPQSASQHHVNPHHHMPFNSHNGQDQVHRVFSGSSPVGCSSSLLMTRAGLGGVRGVWKVTR